MAARDSRLRLMGSRNIGRFRAGRRSSGPASERDAQLSPSDSRRVALLAAMRIGLTVASLIVVAACGTSQETAISAVPATEAAAASTTTSRAVATTEPDQEVAMTVCPGCVEPPDLPRWASAVGLSGEPLKPMPPGTYVTRLFRPTVSFTVPEGWKTAGESPIGVSLTPSFDPPTLTGTWMDLFNAAALGLPGLDWETLMGFLQVAVRPDGSSALDPPTVGGATYPAGVVEEVMVGGFPARQVIWSMVTPEPAPLDVPHAGFVSVITAVTRYVLIDVPDDPVGWFSACGTETSATSAATIGSGTSSRPKPNPSSTA